MSDPNEYVLVMEIEVVNVAGGTRVYPVRSHEGDEVVELPNGDIRITYAPRTTITPDNVRRSLPGDIVTIAAAHVVEMRRSGRYEKRVRPSVASIINRERAEIAEIAATLGVEPPKPA